MVDERAVEAGDDPNLLYPEVRNADPHHHGSQYESPDEELLSPEEEPKRSAPRQSPGEDKTKRRKNFVIITMLLCSLLIAISIAITWAQKNYSLYEIQGTSMEPTISQGDSVLLHHQDHLSYGDIVVFTKPTAWEHTSGDGRLLIKRVLGLPGDTISIHGDKIYVNDEARLTLPQGYNCPMGNQKMKLNTKEIFAVGDNAEVSGDSRRSLCIQGTKYAAVSTSAIVNQGDIALSLW